MADNTTPMKLADCDDKRDCTSFCNKKDGQGLQTADMTQENMGDYFWMKDKCDAGCSGTPGPNNFTWGWDEDFDGLENSGICRLWPHDWYQQPVKAICEGQGGVLANKTKVEWREGILDTQEKCEADICNSAGPRSSLSQAECQRVGGRCSDNNCTGCEKSWGKADKKYSECNKKKDT
jgi:hypothetical protein